MPVGADLRGEIGSVQHGLDDAGGEGGAVEAALVLRHRDEPVDERLLLDDVERLLVVVRPLKLVGLFAEQGLQGIYPSCYCSTQFRLNLRADFPIV